MGRVARPLPRAGGWTPGGRIGRRDMAQPQTLFDKIWSRHVVFERDDGEALLYIDRHLVHDGSRRAFEVLRERGMKVRRPDRVFGTPDHYVSTTSREISGIDDLERRVMVEDLAENARVAGFTHFGLA